MRDDGNTLGSAELTNLPENPARCFNSRGWTEKRPKTVTGDMTGVSGRRGNTLTR